MIKFFLIDICSNLFNRWRKKKLWNMLHPYARARARVGVSFFFVVIPPVNIVICIMYDFIDLIFG